MLADLGGGGAMTSISTWVGSKGDLVRDTVLCAARVGGEEEGSRLGTWQVRSQSYFNINHILAANTVLPGLFG